MTGFTFFSFAMRNLNRKPLRTAVLILSIARALMNDPEVILADEPTGDLDEETEAEIMKLFTKLSQEKKITFIFITHNLELAKYARRQLRMTHGSVQEMSAVKEKIN